MARTRWPPGPVHPGLLPRPGRSDRQRRWVPKNLGPADRSFRRTTRMASADSEVRPEPRPLTIPPRQLIAREAGPKAYPHPPCRFRAAAGWLLIVAWAPRFVSSVRLGSCQPSRDHDPEVV